MTFNSGSLVSTSQVLNDKHILLSLTRKIFNRETRTLKETERCFRKVIVLSWAGMSYSYLWFRCLYLGMFFVCLQFSWESHSVAQADLKSMCSTCLLLKVHIPFPFLSLKEMRSWRSTAISEMCLTAHQGDRIRNTGRKVKGVFIIKLRLLWTRVLILFENPVMWLR